MANSKTAAENRGESCVDYIYTKAAVKFVLKEFGIAENDGEAFAQGKRFAVAGRLMDSDFFLSGD
jgi:hypothetical protein